MSSQELRPPQPQRTDDFHTWLCEVEGYETFSSLSTRRDISQEDAKTWVEDQVKAGKLFTVSHLDGVLIPQVLFTERGTINAPVSELAYALRHANIGAWHTWAWLVSPSGLLSGDIPAEVVQKNQARAFTAAQRHIAEVQRASGQGYVA